MSHGRVGDGARSSTTKCTLARYHVSSGPVAMLRVVAHREFESGLSASSRERGAQRCDHHAGADCPPSSSIGTPLLFSTDTRSGLEGPHCASGTVCLVQL